MTVGVGVGGTLGIGVGARFGDVVGAGEGGTVGVGVGAGLGGVVGSVLRGLDGGLGRGVAVGAMVTPSALWIESQIQRRTPSQRRCPIVTGLAVSSNDHQSCARPRTTAYHGTDRISELDVPPGRAMKRARKRASHKAA